LCLAGIKLFLRIKEREETYGHKEVRLLRMEGDSLDGALDLFEGCLRVSFCELMDPYATLRTCVLW